MFPKNVTSFYFSIDDINVEHVCLQYNLALVIFLRFGNELYMKCILYGNFVHNKFNQEKRKVQDPNLKQVDMTLFHAKSCNSALI